MAGSAPADHGGGAVDQGQLGGSVRARQPGDPRSIGPFRVLGLIGAGGMGRVFLAAAPDGRLAAVKQITASLSETEAFRTRFAREVDASRRVSGAYTAAVLAADTNAREPWLASVFVAGPDLHRVVDRCGPLPEDTLLRLTAGLALALEGVHSAGLVHRDLKPSNVLLLADGPRVVDFGIAHLTEAGARHTTTGTVLGTPGYMAPEQIEGRRPSPATDVFALGAVIAFAATGRAPFGGGSIEGMVYRVMFAGPDLDGVPPRCRELVVACLAKQPEDRPTPGEILASVGPRTMVAGWLPPTVRQMIDQVAADAEEIAQAAPGPATRVHPQGGEEGGDEGDVPDASGPGRAPSRGWRRAGRAVVATVALLVAAVVVSVVALAVAFAVVEVPVGSDRVDQVAAFTYTDGSPMATVQPRRNSRDVDRVAVTLDQVPEHLRLAVVAAEDPSFYSNVGLLEGITQKYAADLVGVEPDTASVWDGLHVMILSVKISREVTKDRILENYLNLAYFGRGAYGVQAASRAYFGKDVDRLTLSEGALLAGVVGSPLERDPAENPEKATERWNAVLDGMAAQNLITSGERGAQRFPEWLPPQPVPTDGSPTDFRRHVLALARAELDALGIPMAVLDTDGLTVTTTIDAVQQRAALDSVAAVLQGRPGDLDAALVAIDPRTGAVTAYYGGADDAVADRAQDLRPPGTAFQPFVLAAALEGGGVGLGTVYDGSSPQRFPGTAEAIENSEAADCVACPVTAAMSRSIDTVFYRMALDVGPAQVVDAAHRTGIPRDLLPQADGGVSLGGQPVRPMDMASALATFATDGVRRSPYIVQRVVTVDGSVLYDAATDRRPGDQVLPAQVARNVTEAMLDVARQDGLALAGERPVAAKSGTARAAGSTTETWYVGYTPGLSTAVWVGTGGGPVVDGTGRPGHGRTLAGPVWQRFMDGAHRDTEVDRFSVFVPLGLPPAPR